MSRVIVKNLPKNIKENRLKDLFAKHGEVTQVKLLPKRRFAYIGFLRDRDARDAIEYMNDTFIDTSKIEVASALAYGDAALPRPWSKYSSGSSANSARQKEKEAHQSEFAKQKEAKRKEEEQKEQLKLSATQLVQREKELLKEIYAVEADPQVNPELHEFLQVMQPGSHKRTWANDSATDMNNRAQKKGRIEKPADKPDTGKVSAKIETVKSKKFGGENVTLVRHHLTFEDSDESEAEEYQDLSASAKPDEMDDKGPSKPDDDNASSGDKLALNSALSDLDWLKAKSSATAMDVNDDESKDNSEEEEEEEEDAASPAAAESSSSSDAEEDVSSAAPASTGEAKFTIRLRGLPFTATEEQLREFLYPLDPLEIRLPLDRKNRPSGRAYIDMRSKADYDAALKRNGDHLGERYIEVSKDDGAALERDKDRPAPEAIEKPKRKEYPELSADDETLAESGRIFVRNLAYACTEDDLKKLFEPFGPLADVYMPLDSETKKSKAIAFVTFVMPEHAVEAFSKLDGQSFQGRLIHLLPAKTKNEHNSGVVGIEDGKSSYKKEQAAKKKARAGDSYNWNTLFIRQDTVADAMADKYGVSKGDVLNIESSGSLAVRMAMGEAHIVAENKEFLRENGVSLDAFEGGSNARSKNTILVKNLPFSATEAELRALFEPFGTISALVFPPSHTMALVDYIDSGEARQAFRGLAYRKFKHEPLYLEWAPENVFKNKEETIAAALKAKSKKAAGGSAEDGSGREDDEDEGAGASDDTRTCTVFVKGLNFETTEDALRDAFSVIGPLRSVRVATKKNPKNPSQLLSMGFGFVEFRKPDHAIECLKKLQDMTLDGKQLTLKLSTKNAVEDQGGRGSERAKTVKGNGTKLIVRNLAFEATKRELNELFSTFGQVKSIRIPTKKFDGSHRGFAFVEFLTKQEAKNAFESMGTSTHLYGRDRKSVV